MSETASNSADVTDITTACQMVVEDCLAGKIELTAVPDNLKAIGITPEAAQDYIQQITQRIGEKKSGNFQDNLEDSREATPEGLNDDDREEFRRQRDEIIEEANRRNDREVQERASEAAAWAVLTAKLASLRSPGVSNNSAEQLAAILNLSSPTTASGSLSSTLLSQAPHLAKLTASSGDLHLDETWKLRQLFTAEKAVDAIVDIMQQQQLDDPIPRSIWREIIQDRFVNFEKLYASMDLGYDHQDEFKDFPGGYAIVKKDQASAKRPVQTEAEWIRVFGAWMGGVTLVYPHRVSELQEYRKVVMELFRAVPNRPSIAIRFDLDVRDRYAKRPFHLDDRSQLNVPLLSQMLYGTSSPSSSKRPTSSSSGFSPSKRAAVPCINWNKGFCQDSELCPNRRLHGKCSECGGGHRAKDKPECQASLQTRARERGIDDGRASSSGKRRA
jgi:hypothetical protein